VPALERLDDVVVLDLGSTENRFHPDWVSDMNARLDEAGEKDGPRALVVTATGKFFSNGLDLEWLSAHESERTAYSRSVGELLARVVALPMVTVAAIQGHAFAAGAMLSLACDFG
jgi:enoyl-CoA hydratase/carnithine racemase